MTPEEKVAEFTGLPADRFVILSKPTDPYIFFASKNILEELEEAIAKAKECRSRNQPS